MVSDRPARLRPAVGRRLPLFLPCLAGIAAACSSPTIDESFHTGQTCQVTLALQDAFSRPERQEAASGLALSASDVQVARAGPGLLFPGGRLYLLGHHLGGEPGQAPALRLQGSFTPRAGVVLAVDDTLDGEASAGGERAEFPLGAARLAAWGAAGGEGAFSGEARLLVQVGDPPQPLEVPLPLAFELAPRLTPRLTQLSLSLPASQPVEVFPEDVLSMAADQLLLGGEGQVELVLTGDGQRGGGRTGSLKYVLPVSAEKERNDGQVHFTAAAFGILPGVLKGQARLRETVGDGPVWESEPLDVELTVEPPLISGLDPPQASRGQWVQVTGRGFLPSTDRGGTLLRLDGEFAPDDGDAPATLPGIEILPDEFLDNGRLRFAFRTEIVGTGEGRHLEGLAARPGRFTGRVTPIVSWDGTEVQGLPWEEGFVVAPTRQLVFLKYLPGFTVSLKSTWGLKNVERQVRQRILEVCSRDYTGVNIGFTDERPRDFLEYTVIEIGGLDPNDRDLFGLDNTTGEDKDSPKDVRNLRLQEFIGGKNAAAEEQGYLAYGGVFLESFRQFSTLLPQPCSLASSRFDEVFSGVAPFLCGRAVEPDEYPGGPRAAEIEQAIRVLGSLVGNTVSHEVGHSLGLSQPFGPPTEFHNLADTPDAMMDAGQYRPFEERAELDGQGPELFETENLGYLQDVLRMGP